MNHILQIFRVHWFLIFVSLVVFSILMALGNWQLKRLAWKEDLLSNISSRTNSAPVAFDEILKRFETGEDVEYIPVYVNGYFQHTDEKHYYATHNGVPGWYVFTPLHFENTQTVFVNRGFVPTALKFSNLRLESLINGKTKVIGLVRIPPVEKPNIFTPENQINKNEFYWRDLKAMSDSVDLPNENTIAPLFIDAKQDQNLIFPIGGTTQIHLPNNHLQYAVTWFGLAFVLVIICSRFIWKEFKQIQN